MRRSHKIWLLTSLYVAQGLPYGFFTQALPVLLRDAGLSLKAISATSLLFLPWALKFLWAPFVDHRGTRRQWLLPLQLSAVVGALALSQVDLGRGFLVVLAAAFLFNVVAACQDVATDGLAVRILDTRERGLANGIQVGAYRIGMILGGGLLLWIFARTDWATMFACMAVLLAVTVLPVLWLREPPPPAAALRPTCRPARGRMDPPPARAGHGRVHRADLLLQVRRLDGRLARSARSCATRGSARRSIAMMKGTVGSVASLAGAGIGGWFAFRAGRRVALLACGVLQRRACCSTSPPRTGSAALGMFWAGTVAEHLLGSMATVALFTLMMDASDPEHAGTDYTLLACAIVFAMGFANFTGAAIADAAGLRAELPGRVRAVARGVPRAGRQPRRATRAGAAAAGLEGGLSVSRLPRIFARLGAACEERMKT